MIDCSVVQLDQPNPQAASNPGPRTAASVLAGSKWSSWSNLFIELVKIVLRGFQQSAQPHQQHALLTCQNIPVQWDHMDQANRHAGFGRSNSCSRRRTTWTNSASQGHSQPSRRRRSMTTLRRARQSACLHQRGHVVHAAHCHAALRLLRSVHPAQHHRFTSSERLYLKSVAKAEYRHCQALQSCRVVFSISVVMYRRQSLHFVAAAPDRWLAAGKTRFLLAILPRQQRQSITQRGHALWPVVALVSAPHHHCISLDVLHLQSVRTARLRYAQEPKSYIASASQVSVSHNSTTLRRSVGSAFGKQRSRASSPARRRALRANGMATSPTAFVLHRSVASNSWQGGVPPYQGSWCRLACASCWQDCMVFVAVVALARYGHRLRRPSGLHRVLFCEVVASHCAKAPFGVAYRWRALPGLQNPPYAKSLRWWLRSAVTVAWSGAARIVRAVACGQSSPVYPAPPSGASPLRGIGPCAPVAHPPPAGAPSTARHVAYKSRNAKCCTRAE